MSVGFTATKLAAISYILPFLLVIHPALIMDGTAVQIILTLIPCILGILLVSSGLESYLIGVGSLRMGNRTLTILMRIGYFVGGLFIMLQIGNLLYAGLIISIATLLTHLWQRRQFTSA